MKSISTIFSIILALASASLSSTAFAKEYPLPPANSRLVGEMTTYIVPDDGRSLESIAAQYEVGLIALMSANPGVDPLLPKPGSKLIIPSLVLLPNLPRTGIIVNLSELRLYYYPKDSNSVIIYPIGIGQLGRDTPLMTTKITEKRANPTWTPTANIRKDYASRGIILPAVVPAGPENPMGLFALRLAAEGGTYLLHGTNANFGIGMRVSSGCIRLRPNNIEHLFNIVPVGTQVTIIDEALKYSIEPDGRHYIEVHQPLSRKEDDDPQTLPINLTADSHTFIRDAATNTQMANEAITRRSGYPLDVTR
jgi:L,D-transpeptidase YcfS